MFKSWRNAIKAMLVATVLCKYVSIYLLYAIFVYQRSTRFATNILIVMVFVLLRAGGGIFRVGIAQWLPFSLTLFPM